MKKPYDGGYLYDLFFIFKTQIIVKIFTSDKRKSPSHESYTLIYEDVIDEFNPLTERV